MINCKFIVARPLNGQENRFYNRRLLPSRKKYHVICYKQVVPPELYLLSLLTPEEFPVYSINNKTQMAP